ncbi:MAG: hypothetical protein EPO21_08435 [Chloroflexota bacterium]|nr:MAG: hypothetical protein EPO21_08435 [Chloroflexota bacterium]
MLTSRCAGPFHQPVVKALTSRARRVINCAYQHVVLPLSARAHVQNSVNHWLLVIQEALGLPIIDVGHDDRYFGIYQIMRRSHPPAMASSGPRVLIVSANDNPDHVGLQSIVAHALMQRGARVQIAICDGKLPICDMVKVTSAGLPCERCLRQAIRHCQEFRIPYHLLSVSFPESVPHCGDSSIGPRPETAAVSETAAVLSRRTLHSMSHALHDNASDDAAAWAGGKVGMLSEEDCRGFTYRGLPLGLFAQISLKSHFLRGTVSTEDTRTLPAYRAFLTTGMVLADAYERLLSQTTPDSILMLNGKYITQRVPFELARHRHIPVVTYECGFQRNSAVFSRNQMANDCALDEWWPAVARVPLTLTQEARLEAYLEGRTRGAPLDNVTYNPRSVDEPTVILDRLRLDKNVRTVSLFTNILWDSACIDKDLMFANMLDWIEKTIEYFGARPDVHLVIRVHPAEVVLPDKSLQPVHQEIVQRMKTLPPNVRVVGPESDLSSYALVDMSDLVLVYTSTVGLEAATRGKTVLVAGETHYRGKGFTVDPNTREDYYAALAYLLGRHGTDCANEVRTLARRYAYLLFFRFMLPFTLYDADAYPRVFRFKRLSDLAKGRNEVLDLICNGILDAQPFLLSE